MFYVDENGDVGVDGTWSPTKDKHLATKKYVDEYIAMQGSGPTKCSWIFRQTSEFPYIPTQGEMTTLKNNPVEGDLIFLSYVPHSGISMFSDRKSFEYFNTSGNTGEPLMTIWDYVESGYRHKFTSSISRLRQDGSGNFEITVGDWVGTNSNISEGVEVWITIAGFF